jgi:conjugal transfer pilus assembly protein TraF
MTNSFIKSILIITILFTTISSFANNYSPLKEKSNEFALVMFTQKGCTYCRDMDIILKEFISHHNWKIKYIDRKENPLLAAKFNIEVAPTVVMIRRHHPESWFPISYGVSTGPEVERNVYRAIEVMKGGFSPTSFTPSEHNKSRVLYPISKTSGEI